MKEYRINISDLAKQDLISMVDYISNDLQEPIVAEKIVDMIIDTIFSLEEMPKRIGLVKDERLAKKGIRSLYVKGYSVFFRINDNLKIIEIVRIIYAQRDWIALL